MPCVCAPGSTSASPSAFPPPWHGIFSSKTARKAKAKGKSSESGLSGMQLYESEFLPNLVRMFLASVEGYSDGENGREIDQETETDINRESVEL